MSQHMSELSAKLDAAKKRNHELEQDCMKCPLFRAWELLNLRLADRNCPFLLDREFLEERWNRLWTLGGWLSYLMDKIEVGADSITIKKYYWAVMLNENYVGSSDESDHESYDESDDESDDEL